MHLAHSINITCHLGGQIHIFYTLRLTFRQGGKILAGPVIQRESTLLQRSIFWRHAITPVAARKAAQKTELILEIPTAQTHKQMVLQILRVEFRKRAVLTLAHEARRLFA